MRFPQIKLNLASILLLGFLTACAANPAADLPPIESPPLSNYTLGPGDAIRVDVFGQQDFPADYILDLGGEISIPLAEQRVVATGLTTEELEKEIAKQLSGGVLVNPRVSVQIVTFRPVTVLGGVNSPGEFSYRRDMTVSVAIGLAQGLTRGAFDQQVKITRRVADGQRTNWRGTMDTFVYPDDVIFVYERF